jgi:hypothetical protein
MKQRRNPKWWTPEHESRWDRVKAAFQRDWDQTKHDLGGKQPDTDQDVDDTIKQAAGKQPIPPRGQRTYEETEDAYRFGYGARGQYQRQYPSWNQRLESKLEQDWRETYTDLDWEEYRAAVRRGWEFDEDRAVHKAA